MTTDSLCLSYGNEQRVYGVMMYDSIIIDSNDENIIVTDNKTSQLEGKESITGNVEPGAWRHCCVLYQGRWQGL